MFDRLAAIAKKAGDIMLSADLSKADIALKSSPGDFVTKYDIAVQAMLQKELKTLLPEASFTGEESGMGTVKSSGYRFIVDPIDGTTNFARDYRHSAISIALADQEKIIIGLVYNPYLNELFYAEAGRGAWLNGSCINASHRPLRSGLVNFGSSPYEKDKADDTFALASLMYKNCLDVRRSGSAALDICYAACGRCELFYEMVLAPWDYAAASLIISEAGGVITTLQGASLQFDDKTSILAGGRESYDDFWKIYRPIEQTGLGI